MLGELEVSEEEEEEGKNNFYTHIYTIHIILYNVHKYLPYVNEHS